MISKTIFTSTATNNQYKPLLRRHGITKQPLVVISKMDISCCQNEVEKRLQRAFQITHEVKILISEMDQASAANYSPSKFPKNLVNSTISSDADYKCNLCEITCKRKETLNEHLKVAHKIEEDIFFCSSPSCKYYCFSVTKKMKHLHKIHGKKPFECSTCSRNFKTNNHLKKHLQTHATKQFQCYQEGCFYRTNSKGNLKQHSARHLPIEEKPFRCNLESCQKTFSVASLLKTHVLKYHATEPIKKGFRCPLCKYAAHFQPSLEMHMRVHTREKPFKCKFCMYSSAREANVRRHMNTHTGEKPNSCSVCKKTFSQGYQLKIHMRIHTGEKPYSCAICKRDFSIATNLKQHMRVHTGEKPFECKKCNYRGRSKYRLNSHIETAHENSNRVRSVSCSFCPKTFYCQSSLNVHLRTHTKEKPFRCKGCNKQYAYSRDLKTHRCINVGRVI